MWRPLSFVLVVSALLGCIGNSTLGGAGGTVPIPDPGACSASDGHVVPYKTVAEVETLVAGDWLRCSGNAFPAEFGVGLRISPDHTWRSLVMGNAGALVPITTASEGTGTWTAEEVSTDHIQFNLLHRAGGVGGIVLFTDSGQMRLDWGGASADYVRLGGGGGGSAGSGGGAGSGGTVSIPGVADCSAPAGHWVPYKTVAELEMLIAGDWLRCSGNAFPAEFGVGLRISPDHTWSALVMGAAGTLEPITTGFDGYGTWTAAIVYADHIQFNLLYAGGGAGGSATFTDSGQMRLDWGGVSADYVRLGAGGGSTGSGGGGGAGGTVPIPDPGACLVPDGKVVPYASLADLEGLIEGDWLRCSGNAFPAAFGVGLRISPDHTWNSLAIGDAEALEPITTGFDGYGTWTDGETAPGHFQFNLHPITGGGAGGFVTFTDSAQMRLDWTGVTADYVRLGN